MVGNPARRAVWTSPAEEDLRGIAVSIGQESAEAADRVLDVLLAMGNSLSEFSERGRVVAEQEQADVREVFAYSYRLVYRVTAEAIYVLGIVHSARDAGAWIRSRL